MGMIRPLPVSEIGFFLVDKLIARNEHNEPPNVSVRA